MEERLQKIIAQAGICSRRAAERLITEGRVKVNGLVMDRLGAKADPDNDLIEVDGKSIGPAEAFHYYMFHKPDKCLTTLKDPRGRPTIAPFLEKLPVRVFAVGRLDMDVEGLLVLTNDGELARRLMHPKFHVPKVYRVWVEGTVGDRALQDLTGGALMIGDRPAAPAEAVVIQKDPDKTLIELTLIEGRKRQVKRMCSAVGHPVIKLKRESFGPLTLGRLPRGRTRPLTAAETRALRKAAGMSSAVPPDKANRKK